jgi:hypothetical protein
VTDILRFEQRTAPDLEAPKRWEGKHDEAVAKSTSYSEYRLNVLQEHGNDNIHDISGRNQEQSLLRCQQLCDILIEEKSS